MPVNPNDIYAFPFDTKEVQYTGLTLRDYFAGKALTTIDINNPGAATEEMMADAVKLVARTCYQIADAMLAERIK